jgi:N-acetylglucosamine-6-phosphate deacetylase
VLDAVHGLDKCGVVFSIGHMYVESPPPYCAACPACLTAYVVSIATSDIATEAVRRGGRLITHLFNAMPQLHHRDPSIIGLLGASPHINGPSSPTSSSPTTPASPASPVSPADTTSSQVSLRAITKAQSEAFDDHETPPQTPVFAATRAAGKVPRLGLHLEKGQVADLEFERPFY